MLPCFFKAAFDFSGSCDLKIDFTHGNGKFMTVSDILMNHLTQTEVAIKNRRCVVQAQWKLQFC